jgi:Arc/MetJ-type ribon-helix-helix transcriptional regulator
MQYPIPPDVQDLIAAQLATGRYQNEDEILREALRALQEASDDGLPLDQAFDLVRKDLVGTPTA